MNRILLILPAILIQACVVGKLYPVKKSFDYKKMFSDHSKSYIYRANMTIYNNELSGMFVIKPQENSHRIVFINEIGMKFFDIEIFEDSSSVHQIFEPINKELFKKLLISDFKFIIMNFPANVNYYKDSDSNYIALKPKKEKTIYLIHRQTGLPENAYKYSLIRKNTFLTYCDYVGTIPYTINLNHKNIKFSIFLTFLK